MEVSAIPRVRWRRIVPIAFLMYTIAYMDRINVGFGFSGMEKSLHISATVAGLAGGIYLLRMIIDGFPRLWVPGNFKGLDKIFLLD